jgi:hypothetical protein
VCDAATTGAAADFDDDVDDDVFELDFDWAPAGERGSGFGSEAVGESSCRSGSDDVGHEADSDGAAGDGVAAGGREFAGEAGVAGFGWGADGVESDVLVCFAGAGAVGGSEFLYR